MSESHRNDFNEPEDEEIPLPVIFQTRRVILNAQSQAKSSSGIERCCRETLPGGGINDFIEDSTENIKIVCNRINPFNYEKKKEGDFE